MKHDYSSNFNEQEIYLALNYQPEDIFNELKEQKQTQEYLYKFNISEKDENYLEQIDNTFVEEIQQMYEFFFLDFVGFFVLFVFCCVAGLNKKKKLKPKPPITLPSFKPTIPCQKCTYFDNNPYLKCALHPLEASTKEAINCSDFQHK